MSTCKRLELSSAFGIGQSSFLKSKGFTFRGAILAFYVLGGIEIESLAVSWEAWIVLFLLRLRKDSLARMPGWTCFFVRGGFNDWSLYMLMSTNSVTCIQNTGEALLAEGRDKVQRHRLLIFYIDARQIKIKWSANMYALRIVNSKGDFASRLERWPSPYAVQQPQKKGNL